MNTHKTFFFGITTLAVAIGICGSGCKNTSADASESPILATDSVRWEDSLSMKSCYARVEISGEYPVTGNLPLLDSVQAWLGNRLNTNVMNVGTPLFNLTPTLLASGNNIAAACGKALLNSAETDFKGFAADDISMDYEYIYNFGPEYVTDSIATYQFTGFGDIGGAHGSTLSDRQSFNANSGVSLTYANVFGPDARAKLAARIRQGLWEQYFKDEAMPDMTLADMLLIDPDTLPLPQTPPAFEKDGITFIYQQYEIAPYAAGMPQCTFPYSDLKPLMLPPAARLLP